MLTKEKDLDAVIIATPDRFHAEQTNACLKAGLHVYCETPMAHDLDAARSMVNTARETDKLLQIGHWRRSSPRYVHTFDRIVKPGELLGRIPVPEDVTNCEFGDADRQTLYITATTSVYSIRLGVVGAKCGRRSTVSADESDPSSAMGDVL